MSIITRLRGQSGPEQDTPPDQGPPKKLNDTDQAVKAIEDQLRELFPHQQRSETDDSINDPVVEAENVNVLIRRVAGASIEEIDRVIQELQTVRDTLINEGKRLDYELDRYAKLNRMSMTAMKTIADSLKLPKGNAG
jgi:hypothetical protein